MQKKARRFLRNAPTLPKCDLMPHPLTTPEGEVAPRAGGEGLQDQHAKSIALHNRLHKSMASLRE